MKFFTTGMLLAPSKSPLPAATPTSVALKTNDPPPPPQQSKPIQVDPNNQSGSSSNRNIQDLPHPPDHPSNQQPASSSSSSPVNNVVHDPQTSYSFKIGAHNVQVSPSGAQVNDKPVEAGSPPVPIAGNSQAWVSQDGSSLYAGSEIYNIAPPAPANHPTSPIQTVLPNGVPAAILSTGTGTSSGSLDDDPSSSSGGKSNSDLASGSKGSNLLSIYGTTLTPGSPAITISSGQGQVYTNPLTLSLDTSNNLIYNPSSYALRPSQSPSTLLPSSPPSLSPLPLTSPFTTSISIFNLAGGSDGSQPLVLLPSGQGVSLAGTTFYPSSVLATATGALRTSGHDRTVIDGTTISLQGTSALVVGGTRTIDLTNTTVSPPPANIADGGSPSSLSAAGTGRGSRSNATTGGTSASASIAAAGFTGEATGRRRQRDRAFHVYSAIVCIIGAIALSL